MFLVNTKIRLVNALWFGLFLINGCASNPEMTSEPAQAEPKVYAMEATTRSPVAEAVANGYQASTATQPATPVDNVDDYKIGPHDLLEIHVFGVDELSTTVRVNARGFISMPLIGLIDAGGLTREALEKRIATRLGQDYLQDPHVTIFIREFASQRITLEGAVGRPGIYSITGRTTLIQAMAMAGGLGRLAKPDDIKLFRVLPNGEKKVMTYDLLEIREGQVEDPILQGQDIVIVSQSASRKFLTDSLFRDITNFINPFSYMGP